VASSPRGKECIDGGIARAKPEMSDDGREESVEASNRGPGDWREQFILGVHRRGPRAVERLPMAGVAARGRCLWAPEAGVGGLIGKSISSAVLSP
jgi:hypothetical protein